MKTITTLFYLLLATSSFGQFLQTGLQWNYLHFPFSFPGEPRIISISISGDTLIQDKTVYELEGTCGCGFLPRHLYQEGQQMYYVYQDTFHLLYDFSLNQGDTLKIGTAFSDWMFEGIDTLLFVIDSVTYSPHIGADTLKIQHIRALPAHNGDYSYADWGPRIIENVGSDWCMFPMIGICESSAYLRCLLFPLGEAINFTAGQGCFLNALEQPDATSLQLSPNPFTECLQLQQNATTTYELRIVDLNGRVRYQTSKRNASDQLIDTSTWPAGLYMVGIKTGGHWEYRKVLKM